MGFFARLFGAKRAESVVLIDIAADSVAGAYARYEETQPPVLLYTQRFSLEARAGESRERTLARVLKTLGETLVREGAPALVRLVGDGRVHRVLVSISAPWQRTVLHTELFEQKTPFTFTKHFVSAAIEKANIPQQSHTLVDASVVGTILNGYETRDPYGKQAHRASVIILTSFVDEMVIREVRSLLRNFYHTREIVFIAGTSLRYQATLLLFPHEQDALILDASGPLTLVAVVRGGLLVDLVEIQVDAANPSVWQRKVYDEFSRLTEKFPLPRSIFLLTRASDLLALREALGSANLGELWLSDNPPKIILILPGHAGEHVRRMTEASPDTVLFLMALFHQVKMRGA